MRTGIDVLESEIIERYPEVLNILLYDQTTKENIIWATNNYSHLGDLYHADNQILPELIVGDYGSLIMPRVHKDKILQLSRSKEMAEVFTPSWVCNSQNNLVDNSWFKKQNVFNQEIILDNGAKSWITSENKIKFPKGKTWTDYVNDIRLEITCGEAPYLVSRYDTTTGEFIPLENRIGLLDRKLRVINENVFEIQDWLNSVYLAYKSIYGFEWQGDSLLLAREALLITFIEHYTFNFENEPPLKEIQKIAEIISWNIWQMDGLKGVVPNSCKDFTIEIADFFETNTELMKCKGCEKQNIKLHNGIYCNIMDWTNGGKETKTNGEVIRFIDLINK